MKDYFVRKSVMLIAADLINLKQQLDCGLSLLIEISIKRASTV